jgi:hypothetical protein
MGHMANAHFMNAIEKARTPRALLDRCAAVLAGTLRLYLGIKALGVRKVQILLLSPSRLLHGVIYMRRAGELRDLFGLKPLFLRAFRPRLAHCRVLGCVVLCSAHVSALILFPCLCGLSGLRGGAHSD